MSARYVQLLVAILLVATAQVACAADSSRWSVEKANQWYAEQPWLVGSNYLPANAINELEMWQAATFDPARIDLELGWAEKLGMNTMRVYLHNLLWRQDAEGFVKRIDQFLDIAARHGIKPILVLFDSCWDPEPHLGPQHPPIPGVHNSGWVQAPGAQGLMDKDHYDRLEAYVKGVVGAFANDKRVLAWDVWNEPDNPGGGNYDANPDNKVELVAGLLPQVFTWARSQQPVQPLTSGLWHGGDWSDPDELNAVEKTQLQRSDILTFHNYGFPEDFVNRVRQLRIYDRPIICTEWMARGNGSMVDNVMPAGKRLNVGMVNWGFVTGESQTRFPWNSWTRPYTLEKPTMWFHDLLHRDGSPYRHREIEIIKALSHSPKREVPPIALSLVPTARVAD